MNPLPKVGELFGEAWRLYKVKWGIVFCLFLLGIPFYLLAVGVPLGICFAIATFVPALKAVAIIVSGLVAAFLLVYTITRFQLATIYAIQLDEVGVKDSLKLAKPGVGFFFFVRFLTMIIMLGGLCFFLIPGLILMVWLNFTSYTFAIEGVKGFKALERSKELTKGRWWPVFGRLWLIQFFFAIITAIPILGAFLAIALLPMHSTFPYVLYKHLVEANGEATPPDPGSKKKILWMSLPGYFIIPAFVILMGGALVGLAHLMPKISPNMMQSINAKVANVSHSRVKVTPIKQDQGVDSKERLFDKAKKAVVKNDSDAFMELYARDGVPDYLLDRTEDAVREMMTAGVAKYMAVQASKGAVKKGSYGAGFETEGFLEFHLNGNNNAMTLIPYGKKRGSYYFGIAQSMATDTMVSTPPPPPAQRQTAPPRSSGMTHDILLKNKHRMTVAVVERDAYGVWVEISPGTRAYVNNNEIASIKELPTSVPPEPTPTTALAPAPASAPTVAPKATPDAGFMPSDMEEAFKKNDFASDVVDALQKAEWDYGATEKYRCSYYKDSGIDAAQKAFGQLKGSGKILGTSTQPVDDNNIQVDVVFGDIMKYDPKADKKAAKITIALDDKDGLCMNGYSVSPYTKSGE